MREDCYAAFRVKEVGESRFERESEGGEGKEEEEEEEEEDASVAAGSVYRPSPSQRQELRSRSVTAQRRSGEKKEAFRELPYV